MNPPTYRYEKYSRDCRLKKTSQIYSVLNNGRRISYKWLSLNILERNPQGVYEAIKGKSVPSRLGIIVKKKVLRKAVERNKLKRSIREFFRIQRKTFPMVCDIVVCAESSPQRTEKDYYNREVKKLFKKSKLI